MTDSQPIKRKKGGQPGNHNALKHGRYIAKENLPISHYTADEQVTVIDHLIHAIKRQMMCTYEQGNKAQTLEATLKTMNTLSMAAIGLCRLLHLYNRMTSPSLINEQFLNDQLFLDHLMASFGKNPADSFPG